MKLKNIWGKNKNENFFRKKIYLEKKSENMYIRIFADTGYELFINGRFAASVDEWCNTRDYDISVFIKEGENTFAIHGINHSGHRGVAFELSDGENSLLTSDGTWKISEREIWGWMLEDFDDCDWENAYELDMRAAGEPQWWTLPGGDRKRIVPTLDCSMFFGGNIPKSCNSPYWNMKETEYVQKDEVIKVLGKEYVKFLKEPHLPKIQKYSDVLFNTAKMSGDKIVAENTERYTGPSFVVDFGGETVGFFRMKINSEKPVSFRLYYGETIDEALSEPSRDICQNRMLREEYRVFGGIREFESKMTVAFRYVRVEFFDCEEKAEASDFSVRTTLYPVVKKGYFSCENKEIKKLWEMGERTLHFCMREYYYDAPKRDRFLWTGDARLEALINYYTFGDTKLFEFCWEQLSSVQNPSGAIPSYYCEGGSVLWDYQLFYVIAFYDYLMYTGNAEFVINHKENIYKAMDFIMKFSDENGIINVPENPLGDMWMVALDKYVGADPYLNRLYLKVLKTAETVARLSEDAEKEAFYREVLNKVSGNISGKLKTENFITEFDSKEDSPIQYEVAEAEAEIGRIDAMMKRIEKRWLPLTRCGADCLYENTREDGALKRIDEVSGEKPEFISYCHAWTGAATILLPREIAGIRPIEFGFKKVEIKPCFDIFKTFKCAVPSPYGEIAVKYENNVFSGYIPEEIYAVIDIGESRTELPCGGLFEIDLARQHEEKL